MDHRPSGALSASSCHRDWSPTSGNASSAKPCPQACRIPAKVVSKASLLLFWGFLYAGKVGFLASLCGSARGR